MPVRADAKEGRGGTEGKGFDDISRYRGANWFGPGGGAASAEPVVRAGDEAPWRLA